MAKQAKAEKPEKQAKAENEMVTVILLKGHPHFNSKLKQQHTFTVSAKLADKGIQSGHWKIVE